MLGIFGLDDDRDLFDTIINRPVFKCKVRCVSDFSLALQKIEKACLRLHSTDSEKYALDTHEMFRIILSFVHIVRTDNFEDAATSIMDRIAKFMVLNALRGYTYWHNCYFYYAA